MAPVRLAERAAIDRHRAGAAPRIEDLVEHLSENPETNAARSSADLSSGSLRRSDSLDHDDPNEARTGVRSIPEKTLEHWVSIDLAQRFPGAALWWPARGEDVRLEPFAEAGSGTTVLLELKTTDARGFEHGLRIDIDQLRRYRESNLPVFYVFPLPFRHGSVEPEREPWLLPDELSVASPLPGSWWQRANGGHRWFDSWLYVLPANEVQDLLPTASTGTRRLLAIDLRKDDPTTFARAHEPTLVRWPDLWLGLADGTARGMWWVSRREGNGWSAEPAGDAEIESRAQHDVAATFARPPTASTTMFVRIPA